MLMALTLTFSERLISNLVIINRSFSLLLLYIIRDNKLYFRHVYNKEGHYTHCFLEQKKNSKINNSESSRDMEICDLFPLEFVR